MKKVLFVILLLCMAFPMRAQEEGTEVIVEDVLENGNESPTLRNPESTPITCFCYPTFEMVELSFLSDLGTADIVVSNLDSTLKSNALKSLGYRTPLEYCKQ